MVHESSLASQLGQVHPGPGNSRPAYSGAGNSRTGHSEALQQVARLFKIITLVRSQTRGRSLGRAELAQACECNIRTIQRDLQLLQEAGIPVEYDYRQKAYMIPEKGWIFPIAPMTVEDALALALARGIVSTSGLPQSDAIRATLDKLTASLSPALSELMREAAQAVQPVRLVRDYSQAPITQLMTAAGAGLTVEIDYRSRSRGEQSWRRVDPYAVAAREGQYWELHGWCHRNQEIRTFALDQVRGMRLTEERFALRGEEWRAFAGAKGVMGGMRSETAITVNVVFSAEVAVYAADRQWPEGLTLTAQENGTMRLTGQVQGTEGIVPELLRWRRYCRVEGGAELKAQIAEEIRAMAALYF